MWHDSLPHITCATNHTGYDKCCLSYLVKNSAFFPRSSVSIICFIWFVEYKIFILMKRLTRWSLKCSRIWETDGGFFNVIKVNFVTLMVNFSFTPIYLSLISSSLVQSVQVYLTNYRTIKKVKWSRYRPGVAQRVGRGIALLFHDRGTRRGWVVISTPRPRFTPRKDSVPILQEAGWVTGPVWKGGKSRPHRDSIPDRPARNYRTDFLHTWVRVSWIEFNNCPTRCDLCRLLHFCRQLYMFRVLTPIIRSS